MWVKLLKLINKRGYEEIQIPVWLPGKKGYNKRWDRCFTEQQAHYYHINANYFVAVSLCDLVVTAKVNRLS